MIKCKLLVRLQMVQIVVYNLGQGVKFVGLPFAVEHWREEHLYQDETENPMRTLM